MADVCFYVRLFDSNDNSIATSIQVCIPLNGTTKSELLTYITQELNRYALDEALGAIIPPVVPPPPTDIEDQIVDFYGRVVVDILDRVIYPGK
jgi:hypothetical protein